jgi:hypothetical protein
MASITNWSRLEPRPRSASIRQSLAAQIRDPLWMLTRQWQFGEFRGEDAGSPAYIETSYRCSPFVGWRIPNHPMQDLTGPLEAMIQRETVTPDDFMRVELGQTFEHLLAQSFAPSAIQRILLACRDAYPLPTQPPETLVAHALNISLDVAPGLNDARTPPQAVREAFAANDIVLSDDATLETRERDRRWVIVDAVSSSTYVAITEQAEIRVYLAAVLDRQAAKFLEVCVGRGFDGVALYDDARASAPALPPVLDAAVDMPDRSAVEDAIRRFISWVDEVFGAVGIQDPPGWDAARLEYRCEAIADIGGGGTSVLSARPGPQGELDWYTFDFHSASAGNIAEIPRDERRSVLPIHVRFRAMPNARWWDFEDGTIDLGAVRADRRDLAKLIVIDFMLIHGNDWFVIPFVQTVGSLCRVSSLIVHDVFGGLTLVERADAGAGAGRHWRMFSTEFERDPDQVTNTFIMPPSAARALQTGRTLENVRLMRDQMTNLVWGIERTIENGIGQPWSGRERDRAMRRSPASSPGLPSARTPLKYRLQTAVPPSWIPFLPVTVDDTTGDAQLERGVMFRPLPGASPEPIEPAGRILRPTTLGNGPYRVREEEVPRSGVTVTRVACRTRWFDGSTHFWITRRKSVSTGEGASGLRFDIAEPTGR